MKNPVTMKSSTQDKAAPQNIKEAAPRQGKKPPKKISEKYLHNAGLAYLQRFTASAAHFKRVMTRKIDKSCNYHKDQEREACLLMLENAVATFERQGLLNDQAYLQGMVTSLRRRGLSIKAIQYKLQQKGLFEGNIKETLAAFEDGMDASEGEMAAAVQFMRRKRLGPYARERMEKHLASLARAGFGFDIAKKALALDEDQAEEILRAKPY